MPPSPCTMVSRDAVLILRVYFTPRSTLTPYIQNRRTCRINRSRLHDPCVRKHRCVSFIESCEFVSINMTSWACGYACVICHPRVDLSRPEEPLEVQVTRLGCCTSSKIWKEPILFQKRLSRFFFAGGHRHIPRFGPLCKNSSLTTTGALSRHSLAFRVWGARHQNM